MGYDYKFEIAVEGPSEWRALPQEERARLWRLAKKQFVVAYERLKKEEDWFPPLDGEVGHTGSGGYGCGGPEKELKRAFLRFSTTFPVFKFFLTFYYWDLCNMAVYLVQNESWRCIAWHDGEEHTEIGLDPEIPVTVQLTPTSVSFDDTVEDITDLF